MQDFKEAKSQVIVLENVFNKDEQVKKLFLTKELSWTIHIQVAASFSAEGAGMGELTQWNELYGEGGSRKQKQLTYFL